MAISTTCPYWLIPILTVAILQYKKFPPLTQILPKINPIVNAWRQVSADIARLLLRHEGIDVNNGRTDDGRTALWMASLIGQAEVVQMLVSHPAIDVNKSRTDDDTRLVIQCQYKGTGSLGQFWGSLSNRITLCHPIGNFVCNLVQFRASLGVDIGTDFWGQK